MHYFLFAFISFGARLVFIGRFAFILSIGCHQGTHETGRKRKWYHMSDVMSLQERLSETLYSFAVLILGHKQLLALCPTSEQHIRMQLIA